MKSLIPIILIMFSAICFASCNFYAGGILLSVSVLIFYKIYKEGK